MKKLIALMLVSFIFFSFINVAEANVEASPSLEIEIAIADENIQPGETINFRMLFRNVGSYDLSYVTYEIIAGTYISGYPAATVEIGGLPVANTMSREIPLSISGSAPTGTHTISIRAQYNTNRKTYKTSKNFNFQVGSDVVLHLDDITFAQEPEPGKTVKMHAHIQNVGSDGAKQLTAKFEANNTTKIEPVLAGATSYVDQILAGKIGTFDFSISIDSSAETETYPATITLNYKDLEGNALSNRFSIGIPVGGTPNLQILNTEIENGEFKVELENLGTAKAKAIRVELIQEGKVMGVDIDNELKMDKHTTLRYSTYKAGTAQLHLTYLDGNNIEYDETLPVSIKKSSSGNGGSSGIIAFILIIVVIVESYYLYKYRKEKEKK